VWLKNLSEETTVNLIEIKDIISKSAKPKREEANSAFPSTQIAYLLLILFAQLLSYGVSVSCSQNLASRECASTV